MPPVVYAERSSESYIYSAGISNYMLEPFDMAVKYHMSKYAISGGKKENALDYRDWSFKVTSAYSLISTR